MTIAVNKDVARGMNTLGYWVGTFFNVALDNNYPTGGYAFAAALVKLGLIEFMAPIICQNAAGTSMILLQYNYVTLKLQAYWCAGAGVAAAEVTNGTDLSTFTKGRGVAFGKG